MKNKHLTLIVAAIVLILFFLGINTLSEKQAQTTNSNTNKDTNVFENIPSNLKKVTLYKDPNCGCCDGHAKMYESVGFEVEVVPTKNLDKIKQDYNIDNKLRSCHTAIMGDYVVEGHIPLEGIEYLLREKPNIKGIALPGMPIGTPGMPGLKTQTFKIYNIENKQIIMEI